MTNEPTTPADDDAEDADADGAADGAADDSNIEDDAGEAEKGKA